MAILCHRSSSGCDSTIKAGFARLVLSSGEKVKTALRPEVAALVGKVLVTGSTTFCGQLVLINADWSGLLLLAMLGDVSKFEDTEATELVDPLRLVEVEVGDKPPKPEKPEVAGFDSSGNRRPVRVSFDSHMRW